MNPRKNASEYVVIYIYIYIYNSTVPYINNHSQLPPPPGFPIFFFPSFPSCRIFLIFLIFYIYIYILHTHTRPDDGGETRQSGGGAFLKVSFFPFSFFFSFLSAHKKRLDGDPPPSHLSLVINNSRYLFLF